MPVYLRLIKTFEGVGDKNKQLVKAGRMMIERCLDGNDY